METQIIYRFLIQWLIWQLDMKAASWQAHRWKPVFTHLCDLFLESECESGASVSEGPCSVGHVLQPLDDEEGWHVEREIPYDMKVWWLCGATQTLISSMDLLHMTTGSFSEIA